MPEMMELAKKDFKTAIVNMLYMFKMIEGNMKMKRKEVAFFKTTNGTSRDEKYSI